MNGSQADMKARMAKYEQELLRLRNQSNASAAPSAPIPTDTVLHVRVTTDQNDPIVGALVTVVGQSDEKRKLQYVRFTDKSGTIEPLELPAKTDVVYEISASAPGFYRKTDSGLRAEGTAVQRTIVLQPLPEYEEEW